MLGGTAEWRLYPAVRGHPATVRPEELLEVIPEVALSVADDLIPSDPLVEGNEIDGHRRVKQSRLSDAHP